MPWTSCATGFSAAASTSPPSIDSEHIIKALVDNNVDSLAYYLLSECELPDHQNTEVIRLSKAYRKLAKATIGIIFIAKKPQSAVTGSLPTALYVLLMMRELDETTDLSDKQGQAGADFSGTLVRLRLSLPGHCQAPQTEVPPHPPPAATTC